MRHRLWRTARAPATPRARTETRREKHDGKRARLLVGRRVKWLVDVRGNPFFAAFFAACFTARWPDHAGPIDDDASVAAEARHRWPYSCCSFAELTFMDIEYAAKGVLACLRSSVGRMHPMMSGSWVAARGRGTSGFLCAENLGAFRRRGSCFKVCAPAFAPMTFQLCTHRCG